jgi:hypothetical protein
MSGVRKVFPLALWVLSLTAASIIAQQPNSQSQSDAPSAPLGTQGTGAQSGNETSDQTTPDATVLSGPSPCWQEAGISKTAMRTRQSIMANAKTQIQNVNSDTALTLQQQRRQIRQIRQNAKQQIAKIVLPEQEKALQQCQRERKEKSAPPDSSKANPPATQQN